MEECFFGVLKDFGVLGEEDESEVFAEVGTEGDQAFNAAGAGFVARIGRSAIEDRREKEEDRREVERRRQEEERRRQEDEEGQRAAATHTQRQLALMRLDEDLGE